MKSLLLTAALALAVASLAVAQPGSGGPGPGTPTLDPTTVPLDGGASLLLAAGLALSLKKRRQRRQLARPA